MSRAAAPGSAADMPERPAEDRLSWIFGSSRSGSTWLSRMLAEHGELRSRLSDESGGLRRFVNVYVDGEDIRFGDGLQTPVPEGAEVQILPAVAGG